MRTEALYLILLLFQHFLLQTPIFINFLLQTATVVHIDSKATHT